MAVDQVPVLGHNIRRNPLSPEALRACDVEPGQKFLWYEPGNDDSLKWGVFTSDPYMEDDEHYVVDCAVGEPSAEQMTVALYSLGITNSRYDSDDWAPCMCRAR